MWQYLKDGSEQDVMVRLSKSLGKTSACGDASGATSVDGNIILTVFSHVS